MEITKPANRATAATLTALGLVLGGALHARWTASRIAPPVGVTRYAGVDRTAEDSVARALREYGAPRSGINVRVVRGAARLSGTVPSERERVAVLLAASSADGVRVLVDDLRVGGKE